MTRLPRSMDEVDAVEMLGGRACVDGRLGSNEDDEDEDEDGENEEDNGEDGMKDDPAVLSAGVVAFRRPVGACERSVLRS